MSKFVKSEERLNKKYGMLTILSFEKRIENHKRRGYYFCRCDCGNELWVRADSISSGKTTSCGCYNIEKNYRKPAEIIGKRFGSLVVLERLDKNKYGQYYYLCQCDCGNTIKITAGNLTSGGTASCGHDKAKLMRDNQKMLQEQAAKKLLVENTALHAINRLPSRVNTSGVVGVTWDNTRKKWVAQIVYQKKRYGLGRFSEFSDAVKVRKEAEEILFKPVLDKYVHGDETADIQANISTADLKAMIYARCFRDKKR